MRKRENEELSMDMADPDSPPAFPFPSQVSWTKDGEEVEDVSSTRVFNYSSIFIGSVQPSDSGVYLLSATNYQLDGSPLDTDTASLTLNVLCKCLIIPSLYWWTGRNSTSMSGGNSLNLSNFNFGPMFYVPKLSRL